MKYLLLLLVIIAVLWFMSGRARRVRRPHPRPSAETPQAIEACAHCGVHMPRGDMVAGTRGRYCSEAHRLAQRDAS